jgi:NAD(P)-dependent dehydrogenase (short-subunit alcohol dehydrogenase family)
MTVPQKKLKILLVGASGTIGCAIEKELGARHTIIRAGRNSGEISIDISKPESIHEAFKKTGKLDAVICAAGDVAFVPLSDIQAEPLENSVYTLGLTHKLMGQVNLALAARTVLNKGGSITLTGGILSEQPIVAGSSASMVNAAIASFVCAAAIEMPHGLRINAVSPSILQESMGAYGPFFRGFEAVPAARVALAFSRSVEGQQTGQVYKVW